MCAGAVLFMRWRVFIIALSLEKENGNVGRTDFLSTILKNYNRRALGGDYNQDTLMTGDDKIFVRTNSFILQSKYWHDAPQTIVPG